MPDMLSKVCQPSYGGFQAATWNSAFGSNEVLVWEWDVVSHAGQFAFKLLQLRSY